MSDEEGEVLNSVLVDNWMLELATSVIQDAVSHGGPSETVSVPAAVGCFSGTDEASAVVYRETPFRECLTALFYLLDVVILHDRIVYDPTYSFTWKQSDALDPIQWLLQAHDQRLREPYRRPSDISNAGCPDYVAQRPKDPASDDSAVVTGGAQFYLELSRSLGLYYWPSPRRSAWIQATMGSHPGKFATQLTGMIDSELERMLGKILEDTGMQSALAFGGFGAAVLSECESFATILETALEVRSTKSCVAFRDWLVRMDRNLQAGDLKGLQGGLRDVREVIGDARKELGLGARADDDPKITLGVSPTLEFSTSQASGLLRRFRPKPYHVVFLREHFDRMLAQRKIVDRVNKLLPRGLAERGRHDGYF
jgi:hypothetical protein